MIATCRACCAVDVFVPGDLDYGSLIYATQGYSFVIDCPPGYYCQPGLFPVTVTIDRSEIPPITIPPGPNGTVTLHGCRRLITGTIPAGATTSQIATIAAAMQKQWAQQQAYCGVVSGLTAIPAGVPITVGNDEQCYTTSNGTCPPGQVQRRPITVCIPADTLTTDLLNANTAQVQAAIASLNSQAALMAQDQAEAQQECGWFNGGNTYVNSCPCSPGCGVHGPYFWSWSGGEFFSKVSQADANAQALCAACDKLYQKCLADGCPAGDCLNERNLCGPNPCPS